MTINDKLCELEAKGLVILENENYKSYKILKSLLIKATECPDLSKVHTKVGIATINNTRMEAFRKLNDIDGWEQIYHSMAANALLNLIGPDILIQRKLNLSIQMPRDNTSLLDVHMDTLSGQSPFEVVMWVPFTKVAGSNGMYYFDRDISMTMRQEMPQYETEGLNFIRQKYWEYRKELRVEEGQVVLFSSTIFHGNVVNETEDTRVSINCRFKNVYSPTATAGGHTERDVGVFYKVMRLSPLTNIGLNYISYGDMFE